MLIVLLIFNSSNINVSCRLAYPLTVISPLALISLQEISVSIVNAEPPPDAPGGPGGPAPPPPPLPFSDKSISLSKIFNPFINV